MTYSFGERHISPGPRPSDENNVRGEGWTASRGSDGFTLSWLSNDPVAHIISKEVTVPISAEEFERLRSDPSAFTEIALKHDPDK